MPRTTRFALSAAVVLCGLAAPALARAVAPAPPCEYVSVQPLATASVPIVDGRFVVPTRVEGGWATAISEADFYLEVRDETTLYPANWSWDAATESLHVELVGFDPSAVPDGAVLRAELSTPREIALGGDLCDPATDFTFVGLVLADAGPEIALPTLELGLLDRVMDRLECCADNSACWVVGVEPAGIEATLSIDHGGAVFQRYEVEFLFDDAGASALATEAESETVDRTSITAPGVFTEACAVVRVISLYDEVATATLDPICVLAADATPEPGPMIEQPASCEPVEPDPDPIEPDPRDPTDPTTPGPDQDVQSGGEGSCSVTSTRGGSGGAPLGLGLGLLGLGLVALRRRRRG